MWASAGHAWIPERSATSLREADLNVLSKLGNQGLEWRLEPAISTVETRRNRHWSKSLKSRGGHDRLVMSKAPIPEEARHDHEGS
jgi:hypothetical protein